MKLFDGNDDFDNEDISKIEIDKDFARRYEHNKKREDLQRLQELEKKHGPISRSRGGSDSEQSGSSSSDDEDDSNEIRTSGKDLEFFDALIKIRDKDPIIKAKDLVLFQSDNDDDDNGEDEEEGKETKQKKKKTYLKDVVAKQVIEEGPDFDDADADAHEGNNKKSYNEEQEELRQAVLKAASDDEDDGEFMKVKNRDDTDDHTTTATADELKKKLVEYFGKEESLDENNKFLMDYFSKKMWVDKDKKNKDLIDDNEIDELLMDEEEIEKQEDYEISFRHEEENLGDRVLGHSRIVEGSVRKKDNARKKQRQSKEERMKIAEMERKEELKHLKNLKKEEMKEKLDKIKKIAGIGEEEDCLLDEDELLDDEFDPEEHDRMMKVVFGNKYYDAEDVDPQFGSDDDDDIEKPNFEKEDELLGLPKGLWDGTESKDDGFLAARERSLKHKLVDLDDDVSDIDARDDDCVSDDDDNGVETTAAATPDEEGKKRKRKKKLSLMKRAKEALMEEYYKLDYEDTIGDLKTRFKYAKTKPNRYGLNSGEILMLDDKELNQYVPLKKITPYREKEWKLPNSQRYQLKMKMKEQLYGGKSKFSKKRKHREEEVSTTQTTSEQEEKEASNGGELSKQAKRRRRQAGLKLSNSRLTAYGKITTSSKSKSKTKH